MKNDFYYIKYKNNDCFKIDCVHNDKIIGFINYRFNFKNRSVWLNKIVVEEKERNQGVGKNLLNLFENDCLNKRISSVEGKYYPETDNQIVKNFYEKNGYSIEREGYDTCIFKLLSPNNFNDTSNLNLIDNSSYDAEM